MKIKVTQEHIHLGERCNSRGCPVFLAIADAGLDVQAVTNFYVRYYAELGLVSRLLPPKAQRFIASNDRGEDVAPFSFSLDLAST